jgi:coenzyme F420 biosynthesis associated uncharacterized protein
MQRLPYLDWDAVAGFGRRAVHPGPDLTAAEVAAVVATLHDAAGRAPLHVAEVSGLSRPAEATTLVVDRATWIAAMAGSARTMLTSLGAPQAPSGPLDGLSGRALGAQLGGLLALVGTRILGQFDPFMPASAPGRLLLVAPNIVSVERTLGVLPADFRLWVCLHEETHRFQFGEAPWLPGLLLDLTRDLLEAEDAEDEPDAEPAPEPAPATAPGRPRSLVDLTHNPVQKRVFDTVTAVMSLLEGHADVMMDRVGTDVVPTLPAIRTAFEAHRDRGGVARLLSRLLGLDLKRAQYRDGAAFCRAVLARADLDVLNLAFTAPEAMPTLVELHDPDRWLRRVAP